MDFLTNNLTHIITAFISGLFGFLGGMKYTSNKSKVRQKAGNNSNLNAAGGDINQNVPPKKK